MIVSVNMWLSWLGRTCQKDLMYNKPAHYYGIDQNCTVLLSYSSSTNSAVRVTMTKVARLLPVQTILGGRPLSVFRYIIIKLGITGSLPCNQDFAYTSIADFYLSYFG